MALPKLTTPTYELEVPSTDEKIKYRPFLVKEEKILLMALESGENKDIINAVKDIVSECTFSKVDLGNMPMFDVEYIFLNIRAKSVGEVSQLNLLCPDDNDWESPDTGEGDGNQQSYEEVTDIIGLPYSEVLFTNAKWL